MSKGRKQNAERKALSLFTLLCIFIALLHNWSLVRGLSSVSLHQDEAPWRDCYSLLHVPSIECITAQ